MKRSLHLPLAIALALGATNALALGLGPVHVNSRLNEPLNAEIPVIQGTAGEAEGLLANLAGAEDFERVGLNRSRLTVPLEFAVTKNARGEVFIKITSKEPVRDSFLDVLVEANWPKGRLLREYAILLDPPATAPATTRGTAVAGAAPGAPGSVALVKREPRPDRSTAAAAPRAPKPAPAAAAEPKPSKTSAAGEYGPVESGETLSAIARAEGATGVTHSQMMLALLKHNPNAFYKNNINALKRGAILRIPSAAEAKEIGSASEAAAQAQAQIEDWRGGRASPTLVADTGGKPAEPAAAAEKSKPSAKTTAAAKPSSERLELVPPKAGKDSLAMADRPGTGGGSAAMAEIKAELSRAKEALTARDQETGELKSRVRELEDLKGKNDRLISLKDSEIAELQRKLREMQDASAKGGAAKPAAAATAAPTAPAAIAPAAKPASDGGKSPPSKDEIWGNADAAAAKPAADAAKPAETHSAGDAAKPAAAATTAASAVSTTVPLPGTPATSTSTPASTPPAGTAATAPTSPAPSAPTTSTATTPTAAAPAATPPKPAGATTPPKTAAKPKPKPAPVASAPWYEEPWVLPSALGGGALLLLLGLFGMRKRKPAAAAERGSIASAFGDSPLSAAGAEAAADSAYDTEESSLREQIARDPANLGLRLELLSIHYAERATDKFEAAAAEMHAYVSDPTQPEWQEAMAMGQEIAPHNPLFSAARHSAAEAFENSARADFSAPSHAATFERSNELVDDFATEFEPIAEPLAQPTHAESRLGFGLGEETFRSHAPDASPAAAKHDDGFSFDLPPLDFEPKPAAVEASAQIDEDYFSGEDAVGTKLDLAKAYMDMGDPEGARSMLDEVIAEGSEAQKAEAQRLLAEVR